MEKLTYLLGDLPVSDREEAIRYYNDYFDEAGEENEADVINKLESPEKVAATIRQDMLGPDQTAGEFSEVGYTDQRFADEQLPATQEDLASQNPGGGSYTQNSYSNNGGPANGAGYDSGTNSGKKEMNLATKIVIGACIVLGAILLIPMAGGIFGGLVGVFVAIVAVLFSFVIAGISMIVAGVIGVFLGVSAFFTAGVAYGFLIIGIALIVEALGILATMFGVWILIKIVPAIIRGVVNLFRRLLHKEEVRSK